MTSPNMTRDITLTQDILHPLEVHGELLVDLSGPDDAAANGGQIARLAAFTGRAVRVLDFELVVQRVDIVLRKAVCCLVRCHVINLLNRLDYEMINL